MFICGKIENDRFTYNIHSEIIVKIKISLNQVILWRFLFESYFYVLIILDRNVAYYQLIFLSSLLLSFIMIGSVYPMLSHVAYAWCLLLFPQINVQSTSFALWFSALSLALGT